MPDVSTIAQQLVAELGDQGSLVIRGKPIFEWCAERGGSPRLAPPNEDYDAIERWDFEDASAIIIWYSADLWDEAAHSADACANDPDLLWVGATDRPEQMEPDQARAAYREKAAQLFALAAELDELSKIALAEPGPAPAD
jgi:hypothetical protein